MDIKENAMAKCILNILVLFFSDFKLSLKEDISIILQTHE